MNADDAADDLTEGLGLEVSASFDELSLRSKIAALIDDEHAEPGPPRVVVGPEPRPTPPYVTSAPQRGRRQRRVWIAAAVSVAAAVLLVAVVARHTGETTPRDGIAALASAASKTEATPADGSLEWSYASTRHRDDQVLRRDTTITSNDSGTTVVETEDYVLVGSVPGFTSDPGITNDLPADAAAFDGFTRDEIEALPTSPDELTRTVLDRNGGDETAAALTLSKVAATPSLSSALRAAAVSGLGVLGGTYGDLDTDPFGQVTRLVVGPESAWAVYVDEQDGAPVSFVARPGVNLDSVAEGDWVFWRPPARP